MPNIYRKERKQLNYLIWNKAFKITRKNENNETVIQVKE